MGTLKVLKQSLESINFVTILEQSRCQILASLDGKWQNFSLQHFDTELCMPDGDSHKVLLKHCQITITI